MNDNARNIQIDILKLISIMIIAFHHGGFFDGLLLRGYMVVDLFFVYSGFFLFESFRRDKNNSTLLFLGKRFKRYFPGYFLSWLIYLFVLLIWGSEWINYKTWYAPVMEMLMIHELGIPGCSRIHYPDWYMSVLFTAGIVIFFLYNKINRKAFTLLSVIVPVTVILYAAFEVGGMEKWERVKMIFYAPWWRGFADMLVGGIIFYLKENTEEKRFRVLLSKHKVINYLLKTVILVIMIYSLFDPKGNDFISLLFIWIAVMDSVFYPVKYKENSKVCRVVKFLSGYEYELYLSHAIVIVGARKMSDILNFGTFGMVPAAIMMILLIIYSISFKELIERNFKRVIEKAVLWKIS
ncbi:MAG: acyltransferase [Lachnospiraceae bacterium]|nr:acyltransferase [Lachnospiraceae bacterium]